MTRKRLTLSQKVAIFSEKALIPPLIEKEKTDDA